MKANRKFKNDEAVSAVIGVILMVAITVAIAATVYVYVSGMLGGGPSTKPTVSLVQSGDFVLLNQVQNGPVNGSQSTAQFVNQTSGVATSAAINYGSGDANNLDGGDTISKPGSLPAGVGDKYTVQVLYGGDVIGTCVYTML